MTRVAKLKETFRNSYFHPRYIANREIRRFIVENGPQFSGTMLDVGCGKRPYADCFTGINECIGMDVPTSMHGSQSMTIAGSVLQLPFAGGIFDSVLCAEVLEHTPDPGQGLKEMARVSRKGARLLITVPLSEQLHELPFDYCRFTNYWLVHLLEASGWRVVKLEPRGGAWLELGYRLSSLLYTAIGARKRSDGNLQPRFFLGPVVIVLCAAIQAGASALDRLLPNEISTIGWCAIGERR